MKPVFILAAIAFGLCAFAQDPAYQDYMAQVEALQRNGSDIVHKFGRDALIEQYRTLIATHPEYTNNIRLETQIAMLYESDFSDIGQPPDMTAAHQVYQNIIASYDPENAYMKTVRKLAADRAVELDPVLARQMYQGIITDYPEEDALVVQSEYALAKLAESQGDPATAAEYYDKVMAYVPSGARVSDSEAAMIEAYRSNAAANTLTAVIQAYDTPEDRLKALKKFLEKHKEFERANAALVKEFSKVLERAAGGTADGDDTGNATIEALLASLTKGDAGEDSADRRDRARAREQRTRDAQGDRVRAARADTTLDAAFSEAASATAAAVVAPNAPRPYEPPRASGLSRTLYTLIAVGVVLAIAAAAGFYARRHPSV